jgi:hypothetical protein
MTATSASELDALKNGRGGFWNGVLYLKQTTS